MMDAACACLRVSYAPVQVGFDEKSGRVLLASRWSCDDCGARFAKEDVLLKRIAELEADKKELFRTIKSFEERIRCKEKEINAANRLVTQRGARMQIMREWMLTTPDSLWDDLWDKFLGEHLNSNYQDWFDADGVPMRE